MSAPPPEPPAAGAAMQPLSALPPGAWRHVAGVFTDIDDTLTTEGAITPDALAALAALAAAGVPVIAVTGRPVGWCGALAGAWPVRAMVAENGAVALLPPRGPAPQIKHQIAAARLPDNDRSLSKLYLQDAATRAANAQRLAAVAARVLRDVPGATLARDSAGRETDIAIDHAEFSHLAPAQIEQVLGLMRAEGLTATVSSIHINGWIGTHDKWRGACWIARELLGIELAQDIARWIYVGDSTNDQVMFEHFVHSVGVANIRHFVPRLRFLPRYVARGERGAGFAEVVARLLADLR